MEFLASNFCALSEVLTGFLLCRVCHGCRLLASYGPNRIVVRYPKLLARYYPAHVTNATIYGRIVNDDYIININPSFYHDKKVCHCYVDCHVLS